MRKRLRFNSVEKMKAACQQEAVRLGMTLDQFIRLENAGNRVLRAAMYFPRDHLPASSDEIVDET